MQWPWSRQAPEQPKPNLADYERLGRLEADMKQLRLEWEETYESVHSMLMKLGKRDKRAAAEGLQQPAGDTISPDPAQLPLPGVRPPSGADRWQQLAALRPRRTG